MSLGPCALALAIVVEAQATEAPALPATPMASPLWRRGYSVIPAPQLVNLEAEDWALDGRPTVEPGRWADHVATGALRSGLASRRGLSPRDNRGRTVIRLSIRPSTVAGNMEPSLREQGYRLTIRPQLVEILGNGDAGLFYGVQTFLQLLKVDDAGRWLLPVGTIDDWPALELRFLHFDSKHHQDRLEALRGYLDLAASLKINMIGFELEDKFEYPSLPIIGAPTAFTAAEVQSLVDYGLQRFVQIVPQIQAPAHMTYVLKHPELAHLRADGNNYMSCTCDEEAMQIIFKMYDDAIRATRGVEYVFLSSDEVYYAGQCDKCKGAYDEERRSRSWVDFMNRAAHFVESRGRRPIAWLEYPLLARHVSLLSPRLIDAIIGGGDDLVREENARGIRQLAYVSMQGAELLFPNYFSLEPGAPGGSKGRLAEAFETIADGKVWKGRPIGVFGAAWDDSGLHPEMLWLGRSAVAQYAWHPGGVTPEQNTAEFMRFYHGPRAVGMVEAYRTLQKLARFWEGSWDRMISKVRPPSYGNSEGKGRGTTRYDLTLAAPRVPRLPDLDNQPFFSTRYERRITAAAGTALDADGLAHLLQGELGRADRHVYWLEVAAALTRFVRHQAETILTLHRVEQALSRAHQAAREGRPAEAVEQMMRARDLVAAATRDGRHTFQALKQTFEASQIPRGGSRGGRRFLHVMDDVKDHFADRRPDLTFMTAPEESIGLGQWQHDLDKVLQTYAEQHHVPVRAPAEPHLED